MKRIVLSMLLCCGMPLPVAAVPMPSENQIRLERLNNTFTVMHSRYYEIGLATVAERQQLANQLRGFIRELRAHHLNSPIHLQVLSMIGRSEGMLMRIERSIPQE